MEQYEQQGGGSVPPQSFYQNRQVRTANNMTIVALVFAVLSLLTVLTGLLPLFFGSLSILFALLAKGKRMKMDSSGTIGTVIAAASMVLGLVISIITYYGITHDPQMQEMFNSSFEQMYGVDFEEYKEGLQHYYETGEMPEFMEGGNLPGKANL